MANLLQVLSDKAKETRNQLTRSVQAPLSATTVSRAELQTTRGPAVLTESLQVTAREAIVPPIAAQTGLNAYGTSASTDQDAKGASLTGSNSQNENQLKPLADNMRVYLLGLAAACFIYSHAEGLLHFLRSTGIGLLDLVAMVCLVAAAPALPRAHLKKTFQALRLQADSAAVAVKALPQMSVEISAMLDEIRAMRHDLGNMAKKTAWLPGS